ncbi:hypothetical protein DFH11DRAFT_1314849 [Phellopilus nigrolimitatus]|nr:hypothetical protein DFH11DRAFT_1314849 [Phellopilus nigrolimitatus]
MPLALVVSKTGKTYLALQEETTAVLLKIIYFATTDLYRQIREVVGNALVFDVDAVRIILTMAAYFLRILPYNQLQLLLDLQRFCIGLGDGGFQAVSGAGVPCFWVLEDRTLVVKSQQAMNLIRRFSQDFTRGDAQDSANWWEQRLIGNTTHESMASAGAGADDQPLTGEEILAEEDDQTDSEDESDIGAADVEDDMSTPPLTTSVSPTTSLAPEPSTPLDPLRHYRTEGNLPAVPGNYYRTQKLIPFVPPSRNG